MKDFYEKYQRNFYSQNGEDGILTECIKRIHVSGIDTSKFVCVEFGAADGLFCSNTAFLKESGLKSHMYDIETNNEGFMRGVITKEITPGNVNELPKCNILSIDCDGPDYGIWNAYKGTPNVVIIEINSSFPALELAPFNDPVLGTCYWPMVQLGKEKGYFLLCHTGNLIFIRNDHRHLFPEIVGDGLENWQEYFQTKWQK